MLWMEVVAASRSSGILSLVPDAANQSAVSPLSTKAPLSRPEKSGSGGGAGALGTGAGAGAGGALNPKGTGAGAAGAETRTVWSSSSMGETEGSRKKTDSAI